MMHDVRVLAPHFCDPETSLLHSERSFACGTLATNGNNYLDCPNLEAHKLKHKYTLMLIFARACIRAFCSIIYAFYATNVSLESD